jgi:hypothetical protein
MDIINSNGLYVILVVGALLIVGVVGKRAGWFKLVSGTNQLLREQNIELRNSNDLLRQQLKAMAADHDIAEKEWREKHLENTKQIGVLQGKVETLSQLPLTKIDETLKEFTTLGRQFVISNDRILKQLEASATITAAQQSDGGLRVNSAKA